MVAQAGEYRVSGRLSICPCLRQDNAASRNSPYECPVPDGKICHCQSAAHGVDDLPNTFGETTANAIECTVATQQSR